MNHATGKLGNVWKGILVEETLFSSPESQSRHVVEISNSVQAEGGCWAQADDEGYRFNPEYMPTR